MSEVSGGPGWWQASDLKWYPPERHPQYVPPLPPPPAPLASAYPAPEPVPAQSGAHRLSDIERNRILDQALSSLDRPIFTGSFWHGTLRSFEPNITVDRSTCSARIVWGKTLSSPIVIVLLTLLSFVTCGLYLPFWLYQTLRPNRYSQTLSIDEHGIQHRGTAPIPLSQRLVSAWVIFLIVWWVLKFMHMWNAAKAGAY